MAVPEKTYYPLESWIKAAKERGMHFVLVKFSRIEFDAVCRAVFSAPAVGTEIIDGVPRRIVHWSDVHFRADGTAYDSKGKRKSEFDLNLS